MRELAEFLVVEMGLRAPGQAHELIDNVADRSINDKRYAINDAKLKALGWSAERKWDEGIRETIEWYRHLSVFPPLYISFESLYVCLFATSRLHEMLCTPMHACTPMRYFWPITKTSLVCGAHVEPPGGSLARMARGPATAPYSCRIQDFMT